MLWSVNKFSQLSFFYQSAEFVYVGFKPGRRKQVKTFSSYYYYYIP